MDEVDTKTLAQQLLNLLPQHNAGLTIEHNPNRSLHETVKTYVENLITSANDWTRDEYIDDFFVSKELFYKAIATNELWRADWYPDYSHASCSLKAADLSELLSGLSESDG